MPLPLTIGTGRALLARQRDPTLALWLRRGVDQYTDVAATVPAGTGDSVAAWRDRDIIASQATLGSRPTRQAGGELAFDGGDTLIGDAAMRDAARNTTGFAIYADATPRALDASRLIAFFSTGTNAVATRIGFGVHAMNQWYLSVRRSDTEGAVTVQAGAVQINTQAVVCGIVDYNTKLLQLYANGVAIGSINAGATWLTGPSSDTASLAAFVGSYTTNQQLWNGDIAEIRAYRAAHDAATVARISAEMAL
jgi:hypothetical protein